jgi:ABC-type transport system involved in cytochrome c biogenesis permease subunit
MSMLVLRIAAVFYAVAAAAYVVYFARPKHVRLASAGQGILSVAFVIHAVAIGLGCREFGGAEFFSLRGGLVLLAFLVAGAFLVLQRFYRVVTVGAFVTPLILVVLVPGLFGTPGNPGVLPEALRQPLLTGHIMTAALGEAFFAIAFLVALMYLLQEREVKGKHFGALFSRLPSLDFLDKLNQRLVRAGFLVFSVAFVAGAVVAKGVWKSAWEWDPQQISALVTWLFYGAMVLAHQRGWHGRRFALLTVLGFALVIVPMITLLSIPGATRHGGTFQ